MAQEKDCKHINLDPVPFRNMVKTDFTDSHTFCKKVVNPIFDEIFPDYYGSQLEVGANRYLMFSFYFVEPDFMDDSKKDLRVIERVYTNNPQDKITTRIKYLNARNKGGQLNTYKLTTAGKEMLEELVPTDTGGKINWNAITSEGVLDKNQYTGKEPKHYIKVMIDINKLVAKLYGRRDAVTNNKYQYLVQLGNPVNPITSYGGAVIIKQWQLLIIQLDESKVNDMAENYGMTSNNLGIIRS